MKKEKNLLVAHPLLNDGFFNRSVIFLMQPETEDEGAFGFVINFRTNLMLRDIRPNLKNGNFPIYSGGPVSRNHLFFFHSLGDKINHASKICDNVWFGGDFDEILEYAESGMLKNNDVKFIIGYSGWAPGQLKDEIQRKAWLSTQIQEEDILSPMDIHAWGEYLYKIKRSLRIFGELGYDVSLN